MSLGQLFLSELNDEAKKTLAILELVPFENPDWKPHEKSMGLVRLAVHVAEISDYIISTLETTEIDFEKHSYVPPAVENKTQLVNYFNEKLEKARALLSMVSDESLAELWTMRSGEQVYFSLPRSVVLRSFCLNHLIHHRAQLGVYLRILNVPLPGTYGPSADTM